MGYEVDFLPVEAGERSGDAICVRFGNLLGSRDEQVVLVIDGGFADSGRLVVDHIKGHYHTNRIDAVVSTHPDADHANGLQVVLESMSVGCLLMHRPWNHTDQIACLFKDGRVTDASVAARLKALEAVRALESTALRRGIPIHEPFAGDNGWGNRVRVLGPSRDYYRSLLPHFRLTPEPKPLTPLGGLFGTSSTPDNPIARALLARTLLGLGGGKPRSVNPFSQPIGLGARALSSSTTGGPGYGSANTTTHSAQGLASILGRAESWMVETLDDDGETSAENNSATIILLEPEPGHLLLLTSDAGVPALTRALDHVGIGGFDPSALRFIQVPHHGSRRNVSPAVLDRLLGPRLIGDMSIRTAFVSASKEAPKHPARKVTNGFRRRGTPVFTTEGRAIWHRWDAPPRASYSSIEPAEFYTGIDI